MNNQNNPVKSSLPSKFNRVNQKGNLYLIIAIIVGVLAIGAVGFASWKYFGEVSDLEKNGNKIIKPIVEKQTEESEIISKAVNEIANWKTYNNPEVNFTFKYSNYWEIKEDYQYKSVACSADPKCKGVRNIFLNKMEDSRIAGLCEREKCGIAINMPQCNGIKNSDLPGNNWICLFDESPDALKIYQRIKDSFQLKEKDISDWKTYRNKEYGFELKYPKEWTVELKNNNIFGFIDKTKKNVFDVNIRPLYLEIKQTSFSSINEWFKNEFSDRAEEAIPKYQEFNINNIKWIKFDDTISMGGCTGTFVFIKNFKLYYIDRHGGTCDYADELFDQILSTFKFSE